MRRIVALMPAAATSFADDGDGLRTAKTAAGDTTQFAWDRSGGLPNLLSDGETSYIYGPDGRPLAQITSTGTTTYCHHDQLGSTRLLTRATGSAVRESAESRAGRAAA